VQIVDFCVLKKCNSCGIINYQNFANVKRNFMTKRILMLFVVVAIVFVFAACGQAATTTAATTTAATTTAATTTAATTTAATTTATTTTAATTVTTVPVVVPEAYVDIDFGADAITDKKGNASFKKVGTPVIGNTTVTHDGVTRDVAALNIKAAGNFVVGTFDKNRNNRRDERNARCRLLY
jgi:hypothetical protein